MNGSEAHAMSEKLETKVAHGADLDEFLWGAAAIAREAGLNPRQAFDKLQRGLLPGKKNGDMWVSTRRAIREALTPTGGR
jgi:hypothetical protein